MSDHRRTMKWELLMLLLLVGGVVGYLVVPSPATSAGSTRGDNQVLVGKGSNGGSTTGTDNCLVPSDRNGNCQKAFGVSVSDIGPIYPGQTRQLPVRWSNPNSFDIQVESYSLAVVVPPGTAGACPASSLQVAPGKVSLIPKVTVPRQGSSSSSLPVTLPVTAPDGCQRVPFAVTVNATAVMK